MQIIHTPQSDGGVRYLALSDADAAAVRRDPAMLDAVKPLGVVDWYRYGPAMWGATGPRYRDIPRDVRAALTAAIAE